jgi:hypothetical protein
LRRGSPAGSGRTILARCPHARKARSWRFAEDGLVPNHPRWPLVIDKSTVRLPDSLDPAAVFLGR